MNKFYILFFLVIYSCGSKQNKETEIVNSYINHRPHNDFLKHYEPLYYIKNTNSGLIEKFQILIDTNDILTQDDIKFYKINITDFSDSIYVGLNKNILYTYNQPVKYLDQSLILRSNNKSGYHSYLFGFDYRIDEMTSRFDGNENDTIYEFSMSKLIDQEGSDYFYDAGEFPNKVFQKIEFSKKRGIIKAVLFDIKTKETYETIYERDL